MKSLRVPPPCQPLLLRGLRWWRLRFDAGDQPQAVYLRMTRGCHEAFTTRPR
jgi:hypothetical protein